MNQSWFVAIAPACVTLMRTVRCAHRIRVVLSGGGPQIIRGPVHAEAPAAMTRSRDAGTQVRRPANARPPPGDQVTPYAIRRTWLQSLDQRHLVGAGGLETFVFAQASISSMI